MWSVWNNRDWEIVDTITNRGKPQISEIVCTITNRGKPQKEEIVDTITIRGKPSREIVNTINNRGKNTNPH